MSSHKQITKAAGVIGLSTVASRILGFVRDAVVAMIFGASLESDAFQVAFRIPNTLRRLVGEGAMTVAFIPVFIEERQRGEEHAWAMANAMITLLVVMLIGITLVGVFFTPLIIRVIAPGFHQNHEKFELTVYLTRMIFPYIILISLTALGMGILNSLQHFFSPAFAPTLLNLSLIGCALWLGPHLPRPIVGQSIGVLLGGIAQLVFQIPALYMRGFRYRVSFDYKNPAVRKVGKLMIPAFFGLAVSQLAVFTDTVFASFLAQGSVTYLFYADRLMEFPLGIFGMAVATAILPTMSLQTAQGDYEHLTETLSFALRLVAFIMIPATVGLIVLRIPIVTLLFQHGKFTVSATYATAQAVLYYAFGMVAIASARIVVPVFYALKDTATPVKCGAVALVVNIICNAIFMIPLKHGGLALATSFSSFCNLVLLIWLLRKRLGRIGWTRIAHSMGKVFLAALIMGISCVPWVAQATRQPLVLLAAILFGIAVFLGCAYLLKSEELLFLKNMALRRQT